MKISQFFYMRLQITIQLTESNMSAVYRYRNPLRIVCKTTDIALTTSDLVKKKYTYIFATSFTRSAGGVMNSSRQKTNIFIPVKN